MGATAFSLGADDARPLRLTAPSDAGQPIAGGVCKATELTTSFGRWFSPSVVLIPNRSERVAPDDGKGVGAERLFIRLDKVSGSQWKVAIRDGRNRLLTLIDASDFKTIANSAQPGVWTGRLDAPVVFAELVTADKGVQLVIEKGIALPPSSAADPQLFSLQSDVPTWEPIYTVDDATIRRLGAVVGMMHSGGVSRAQIDAGTYAPQSWCCSGVMISSDLYITNYHCGAADIVTDDAWDQEQCDTTVIDLGWEAGGVRRQFACRSVLAKDRRLDFAIMRVAPVAGSEGGRGGSLAATVARTPAAVNDQVFVIHHAACQPKLVSRKCDLLDRRRSWLDGPTSTDLPEYGHNCDTEPGASGAPVFNSRGEMVALHHLGFKQCGGSDKRNAAVGVTAIMARVRTANPALAKELGW